MKGYGAHQELAWLFKGQIFDARRALPVISVAVLFGVIFALARWRANPLTHALFALFVACLLLSFGSTTWGALADLVPAHADLYFRRFNMGSQLAGIYLAGAGVVGAWNVLWWFVSSFRAVGLALVHAGAASCFAVAAVAWFSPAVLPRSTTTIAATAPPSTTNGRPTGPRAPRSVRSLHT